MSSAPEMSLSGDVRNFQKAWGEEGSKLSERKIKGWGLTPSSNSRPVSASRMLVKQAGPALVKILASF